MKILLVVDQFDEPNNGTTISARRFAKTLEKEGHEVQIAAIGEELENKHTMEEYNLIPIIKELVHSHGMKFAKPDDEKLRAAIKEVDIVHCYTPFLLSLHAVKIAKELGVPATTAFHVMPEVITSALKMGKVKMLNERLYKDFNEIFFKYFNHIHCPSQFIANELLRNGYTQNLYVISNGIAPEYTYHRTEKPEELKDKFIVTMVGRLSREKRQDLIIRAVKRSKYKNNIQIMLAGKGPKRKLYERISRTLPNPPIISFYNKKDLMELLSYTDLYIHTADMEIEGLSCTEAIAMGNVPVIAEGPKTATSQFAIVKESIFENGNVEELKERIEYWYENNEYREQMQKEYALFAKNYTIDSSAKELIKMFEDAIEENNEKKQKNNN